MLTCSVPTPPEKVAVTLPSLPSAPGRYRIQAQVDYLTQHIPVPVILTLPTGYSTSARQPAIVFLADTDQEPDADGFYVQGPDKLAPADPLLQFIGISPQLSAGRNYTQRTTIKALAAVVTEVTNRPTRKKSGTGDINVGNW